jgi:hypothetical protein
MPSQRIEGKKSLEMKRLAKVCASAFILIYGAGAQNSKGPALRKGVSVQMPAAEHAVEMRAADQPNATVIAVTADGSTFVEAEPAEPRSLSNLNAKTVYVKIDSRAPFQTVLTVLDSLRGKSVVLLSTAPPNANRSGIVPPYGIKLEVSK